MLQIAANTFDNKTPDFGHVLSVHVFNDILSCFCSYKHKTMFDINILCLWILVGLLISSVVAIEASTTIDSSTSAVTQQLSHGISRAISYGVDHSFPVHHGIDYEEDELKTHHSRRYEDEFLGPCVNKHSKELCTLSESYRKHRNLYIPRYKENYTDVGFLKMRAPTIVMDAAVDLFQANKHNAVKEYWHEGKTYTNHWDSKPLLVNWER